MDFSQWPRFYVLPAHLSPEEFRKVGNQIVDNGGHLTGDIAEAQLVLTAINSQHRAKFEIQIKKVKIEVVEKSASMILGKRKRGDDSITEHTVNLESPNLLNGFENYRDGPLSPAISNNNCLELSPDRLLVLKLEWLQHTLDGQQFVDIEPYVILEAKVPGRHLEGASLISAGHSTTIESSNPDPAAKTRAVGTVSHSKPSTHQSGLQFSSRRSKGLHTQRHLTRETTSEHDEALSRNLPEPPMWVRERKIYACERSTPAGSPNEDFITLLKRIKLARVLNMDEIGVRAYSTSIASIYAYPYPLSDPRELLSLPGCEQKISDLFREYQTTGQVAEAEIVDKDSTLNTINLFYSIWGIGAKTARDFYNRGWRDIDDIIEHGWNDLSRVQQIGIKYADEFEKKIPRSEVEFIASVVTYHAKQLVDDQITCTIVGSYRRGKSESGDVDIILSHPQEQTTKYLIRRLVQALEDAQWITHTLILTETNSARDQEALGLRTDLSKKGGFDTLDKALLVWQDPSWASKAADRQSNAKAKNPNIHRRVDIIISPWRTVGCAVAGWSSGTTFQRDLRRYAKNVKGWKFDSSGVRDRSTGRWVDLEKYSDENNRAETPLEAEKRVFEGFGLEYVPPEYRCTG